MYSTERSLELETPSGPGPCVCTQLRRATRKLSALYDKALAGSGLTITQHSVLIHIARAREVGRSSLAAQLGMDRTTLSRILKPLEQAKLVRRAGSADRRERLLRLSAEGERRLKLSYARWEEAQREFESHIGPSALKRLRDSLKAAEKAAGEASI